MVVCTTYACSMLELHCHADESAGAATHMLESNYSISCNNMKAA